MRPLQLDLVAFRSYQQQSVDWRPHDLVVIAGATGAGKSSLLDGICFALYGRTPETTRASDLLSLGADHGEVRLTFARDGEVWRVTRRFGPRAPEPAAILERLSGDGGEPVESLIGADAIGQRLEALVGLGFTAFTSAVVLAQGRFAQFLQAKPAERDRILRELFGIASLEEARQAAANAQKTEEGRADAFTQQLAMLPDHRAGDLNAAARRARAGATHRAALAALVPRVEGVRQAHRVHERALARSAELERAVERLPSPQALIDLGERLARADAGAAAARERRAQADRGAEDADRALRAARERHGGTVAQLSALAADAARDMQLAAREPELRLQGEAVGRDLERIGADLNARDGLRRRVQAHAAWVQARTALARARERMDADHAAAARAHTDLVAAQAAHAAARSAREAARRADLAAALRVGLEVGDDCPVCGSTVAHLPHGESRVAAAEDEVRALRAAAEAREQEHARALASGALAGEAHSEAATALAQAERELVAAGGAVGDDREALARELERLDAAAAEHARLQERAAGHQRERESVARERATLAARLGRWAGDPDAVETLRRAADELAALDERAISAATAARAAAGDADRARTALEDLAQRELVPIAQTAGLVAHLTDLPAPAPGASAAQVIGATRELTLAVQGVLSAARDDAATAAGALEELRAHLAADARPLGVESLNAIVPAVQRAQRELDVRRSSLSDLMTAARQARLLADRAAEARRHAERHRQVAADLRVDRFPRFLLQRYLTRLAAGASRRLETLSGGAYRFAHADRDPLTVVDVRRGERLRAAGTLSGGERFLASLALALGLADIAAESGGRLECLFLDEGFSTLDADSLEQALEGVERLADDGRLVGVITHLPGVAERLGAAIEVRKDPAGVSRIGPHTAVETPVGG